MNEESLLIDRKNERESRSIRFNRSNRSDRVLDTVVRAPLDLFEFSL